ncbi:prolyl oligopeptidase family serine peptidase [Rhodococcoides kyotonense]|uniref:Prolyl oligopeptidase family protein n=1 Tax=Rhodococcoides kyotonense TaxID=398843 RepID=A0A239H226_9NOCA|nr:prolyl oligopeptidase family serine peptidase [Rhodococcus kyotonensis]SNS75526.1 Prolyl oligopeptidase family protein [Rhodococcus kyotonensis]
MLWQPNAVVQRASLSPDGRFIAASLATHADEAATLVLLDVGSGRERVLTSVPLRYDAPVWDDVSTFRVFSSPLGRLVTVDCSNGLSTARIRTEDVVEAGSARRVSAARIGVCSALVVLHADRCVIVLRGSMFGEEAVVSVLPPTGRILPHSRGILAVHGNDVVAYEPNPSGHLIERWRLSEPGSSMFAVAGDAVAFRIVDRGRTALRACRLDTGDRVEIGASLAGSEWIISGIAPAEAGWEVRVESPLDAPRLVRVGREVETDEIDHLAGQLERHCLLMSDGENVDVVLAGNKGSTGPILLTCYGGFGVPLLADWEPSAAAWIESGGRYGFAQIRGGSERGHDWWVAGRGRRKERAVLDVVEVARALARFGIARSEQIVLAGASLGGTVAAAAALRAPDAVAGVVATAAPLDLSALRENPLGLGWMDEFGADGDMSEYDPYLLAARVEAPLPSILLIRGSEDTRVAPESTTRFHERLQTVGANSRMIDLAGFGHGANSPEHTHLLAEAVLNFAADVTALEVRA